jgi:hypothetical protein
MMARSLDTVQGTDENRSAQWLQMFNDRLAILVSSTLTDVPLAPTTTAAAGRRVRFTQLKRVDGYSAPYDDDTDMDS